VWFNVDGLHNLGELEYAAGLCEQADVPYWILLQHGYEDFFIDGEHQLAAYCRIATGAKRFVFIAERNRRALERAIGQCLNNAYRSHNSLAAERFKTAIEHLAQRPPGSGEEAEFFNLGRFAPKDKGQHLILEALSSEAWRGRNWRISFVGVSGFGAEYLERMAAYFGLAQDRIRFVPFTDNVFAEIASRDVLLMPSLAEGTPYAMIESMACGRPAVGTPIGGIPELIQDGITGWLARTTNVADIADAMERMWDSRDKWVAIGQSARRLVEVQNNETFVYADILDALEADTKR
jgi:glycosyltransferase involved in cell wall biosynthesis